MIPKHIYGFVIDANEAITNEQGDIVISIADIDFPEEPYVFLTSNSNGRPLTHIPTVNQVTTTHITIRDENVPILKDEGYYLNVIVVHPYLGEHDVYANKVQKKEAGKCFIREKKPAGQYFLTPFWEGGGSVGSIETICTGLGNTDLKHFTLKYYANSINHGENYFINHLHVGKNADSFSSGSTRFYDNKEVNINLPHSWPQLPCIILTPDLKDNTIATYNPTINNCQTNQFDIVGQEINNGFYVNWLAVPRDVPRLTKNNHLDEGFNHIFEHFPNHKDHINVYREELENIILKGHKPSSELLNKQFDFTPSHPRTRTTPTEEGIAIAKFCFDAISLIINAATAIKVQVNSTAIIAIAAELEEASAERQALEEVRNVASDVAALFDKNNLELDLEQLKNIASGLKNLAKAMFSAGLIKSILVAIYEQFNMAWYKWLITGVTIAAQITALALSGGAAAFAWIARIIALIGSAGTLGLDAYALIKLETGKK